MAEGKPAAEQEVVLRWLNEDEPRIVHAEDRDYYRDKAEALDERLVALIALSEAANDVFGWIVEEHPAVAREVPTPLMERLRLARAGLERACEGGDA